MGKIKIITHDGEVDIIEVKEFDAAKTVKEINDSQEEHVIAFGDYIFSKINIKTIKPYSGQEEKEGGK